MVGRLGIPQVIRQYHGHLSGIYSLALHPTLDVIVTGGRDSVARVWDMRTKVQVRAPIDEFKFSGRWIGAAAAPLASLQPHIGVCLCVGCRKGGR